MERAFNDPQFPIKLRCTACGVTSGQDYMKRYWHCCECGTEYNLELKPDTPEPSDAIGESMAKLGNAKAADLKTCVIEVLEALSAKSEGQSVESIRARALAAKARLGLK